MEREVIEILSEYLSPQAAANLLARAKARLTPTTPRTGRGFWRGRFGRSYGPSLPFREMPPGLRPSSGGSRRPPPSAQTPRRGGAGGRTGPRAVDLADPEERDRLARSLARLEG